MLAGLQREDLAPVRLGLLDRLLQPLEEVLGDPEPLRVVGRGHLDPQPLDPVELGALLQEDRELRPVGFEEPEAVLQAADGLLLADVDLLVERRDRLGRVVAVPDQQLREADPLEGVRLADAAEERDGRPPRAKTWSTARCRSARTRCGNCRSVIGEVLDRGRVEVGLDQGMDLGLPLGHAHGCSPGGFLVAEPLGPVVVGIGQVVLSSASQAAARPRYASGVLRAEPDGLAEIGDGGLEVLDLEPGLAAVEVGGASAGLSRIASVIVGDRRLGVALGGTGQAPVPVGVGEVGVEGDGPGVVGDGGLEVVVGLQGRAPAVVQPGHLRGGGDRPVVVGDRAGEVAQVVAGGGPVAEGLGGRGSEPDRLVEVAEGPGVVALGHPRLASGEDRLGLLGLGGRRSVRLGRSVGSAHGDLGDGGLVPAGKVRLHRTRWRTPQTSGGFVRTPSPGSSSKRRRQEIARQACSHARITGRVEDFRRPT